MRAYIDTNILVDLVLSRDEFLPEAQHLFALGYAGDAQLMVSFHLSTQFTLARNTNSRLKMYLPNFV